PLPGFRHRTVVSVLEHELPPTTADAAELVAPARAAHLHDAAAPAPLAARADDLRERLRALEHRPAGAGALQHDAVPAELEHALHDEAPGGQSDDVALRTGGGDRREQRLRVVDSVVRLRTEVADVVRHRPPRGRLALPVACA